MTLLSASHSGLSGWPPDQQVWTDAEALRSPSAAADVARFLGKLVRDGTQPFQGCHLTGPKGGTRNSVVFRCTCAHFATPLAIKFCCDAATSKPDKAEANRQFASLQRVAGASAGQFAIRAPKPVMLIEEQACVVMEWIEGRSMAEMLTRLFVSNTELGRLVSQAGSWLCEFHQLNPKPERAVDTSLLLMRLEPALSAMQRPSHPVLAAALRALQTTALRLKPTIIPAAWRHGDFKAQNLMISNGSLVAIDLASQDEDVVTADIAKFINDLEFLSWFPRGWRIRYNRDYLVSSFIAGYMARRRFPVEIPLAWMRLYMLVRFWTEFEATAQRTSKDRYQRYCFRTRTNRLTAELDQHFA